MKPAPILFVDHALALGGAEIGLLRIFDLLERTRFAPHLATQPGQLAAAARLRDVPVHEVPLPRLRGQPAAAFTWARGTVGLARVIAREHATAVVSNTQRASFYVAAAATLTRRPIIWYVHDIFRPGPYVRVMTRLSAAVVAISKAVAAPLPATERLQVVYPGIAADDFQVDRSMDADRLRAEWGIPGSATLIGQIARLQPWKGQRDVIRATATLVREMPNLYVAIIGGDLFGDAAAYEAELKADVRDIGVSDRIRFAGHLSNTPAALQAVDILVHASDQEPFGLILIEAGAASRPVVAYASGAAPEIVIHEETGLLVPPGDVAALCAALRRLATDPAHARALGVQARLRVCEQFSAARAAVSFAAVLEAAIAGDRAPDVA